MTFWDFPRLLILVIFALGFAETAAILKAYSKVLKKTRRLLPRHVVLVSVALLGLECVAMTQTIERFGSDFSLYIIINLVLLTLAWLALRDVRRHITRKVEVHQEIIPLIRDPKDMD